MSAVVDAAKAAARAGRLEGGMPEVMLSLLPRAKRYAIAPVSTFRVGAVARGSSGALYLGANIEYVGPALNFTVHAEQAATINAWQHGEEGLEAIAVTHAPCGYCRQFLYELAAGAGLTVHVGGKTLRLGRLLRDPFGPEDLDKTERLMVPDDHGLTIDPMPRSLLVTAALRAADASYAPHTGSFAGVAIETASGAVYAGRYAENAAFNPSVSPLQSALVMRALAGHADDAVTRAVLVETASSIVRHEAATRELLRLISNARLRIYRTS